MLKLLLLTLTALPAAASGSDERIIDPPARGALSEMVKAYRNVKSIEQESEYNSRGSSAARIL